MKEGSRANALLVELLLVIFFFMISAAILVQVFADAKLKSRTAHATNSAMLDAQNIAEELYGGDGDQILSAYGFTAEDSGWTLQKDGYVLHVTLTEEDTGSGVLRTYAISGIEDGKTLLTLPSSRYIPREVTP